MPGAALGAGRRSHADGHDRRESPPAKFITPIPKPRKHRKAKGQTRLVLDEGLGLSTADQQYDLTSLINELRQRVDQWRAIPNPGAWGVTPETARLLQHWRHHPFEHVRPFFCQLEAVETAIWLTEVAPSDRVGRGFLEHLKNANAEANPELSRLALKLATGSGKTTVMAMLIAWQTVNAVRRPQSSRFTRGFLVVTPGITTRTATTPPASWYRATCCRTSGARGSSSRTTTRSSAASGSSCRRAGARCSRGAPAMSWTPPRAKARCSSA